MNMKLRSVSAKRLRVVPATGPSFRTERERVGHPRSPVDEFKGWATRQFRALRAQLTRPSLVFSRPNSSPDRSLFFLSALQPFLPQNVVRPGESLRRR